MSCGTDEQFSNMNVFLEIQRLQQIQGNRLSTSPTGGRVFQRYEAQSEGLKEVSEVIENSFVHDPILQTSFCESTVEEDVINRFQISTPGESCVDQESPPL